MAIIQQRPANERPDTPAPMGHNQPPLEERVPIEFREELLAARPDFMQLMENFLGVGDPNSEDYVTGVVDRAKCATQQDFENCGKLINALRKMEQHIDATHKVVKQPYLEAGRLVDAEKNGLVGRVRAARDRVQALLDAYAAEERRKALEAEAERQAEQMRQAEERRRLEEVARAAGIDTALIAPAPAPEPVAAKPQPIRTDGATISFGVEHDARVTDYAKAFKHVKNDAKVREAIDAAIKRIVKGAKGNITLAGVEVTERAKASAR